MIVCLLLSLIALVTGCSNSAQTHIDAEKNYDYTQFLSDVLVVDQFSDDHEEVGEGLTARMRSRMEEHGRTISFLQISDGEFEVEYKGTLLEKALEEGREANAKQVLVLADPDKEAYVAEPVMTPSGHMMSPGGGIQMVMFARVYDVQTEEEVWVAEMRPSKKAFSDEKFGRGIADDLIAALIDHALLPSFMRLPEPERITR
ncbi:hypothetical protein CRI94_04060 [Longibacter salinarum]|uniref:DUF4136 domain-containing protein n=1 Tax=Longibacter salinarum TaxID=1850348 RepID=A0A2A8CZU5_9BACT|nr:hypothetical protein CRI94_04060 [Longibacter salinarum]